MTKALGISEYLDALSASGIRGMRVAAEAGTEKVTLNDFDPRAVQVMRRNVARNQLDCVVSEKNANVLMHQEHFQAVDLDPFGSPSPYISAASRSARSYLFITATDTAPLCGAHLKSGIRKYMAVPLCTDYHREMGARILLGLAARELARLDKGTEPLLTHVTDHYVRTYDIWSTAIAAEALRLSGCCILWVYAATVVPEPPWPGPYGWAKYRIQMSLPAPW